MVVGLLAVLAAGWPVELDSVLALGVALNIVREGAPGVALEPGPDSSTGTRGAGGPARRAGALRRPRARRVQLHSTTSSRAAPGSAASPTCTCVPGDWSLRRAAALRDGVEQALMDAVPGLRVTLQLLPLTMEARAVQLDGHARTGPRVAEVRHEGRAAARERGAWRSTARWSGASAMACWCWCAEQGDTEAAGERLLGKILGCGSSVMRLSPPGRPKAAPLGGGRSGEPGAVSSNPDEPQRAGRGRRPAAG